MRPPFADRLAHLACGPLESCAGWSGVFAIDPIVLTSVPHGQLGAGYLQVADRASPRIFAKHR